MTSPVAYWHVPDLEAKLAEVPAAGAAKEPARDVDGGRLGATVTDHDGNVLGLLETGEPGRVGHGRACTRGNDERKEGHADVRQEHHRDR